MLRRRLLIAAAAAAALAASGAAAAPLKAALGYKPAPGDMSLGSSRAKIQLVEYASLSCSHCARFNAEVFPAFKAKYVDTGQVRYTLREMLTPPAEVAAAGFMMARCAGPANYFKVVDAVFRSQPRWGDGAVLPVFTEIAKANGMSEAGLDACLKDPANTRAMNARLQAAIDAGVQATPTFFVNGRKVGEGEMSLKDLDAAIAAARK